MNKKIAWKIFEAACLLTIFCGITIDAYLMGEMHEQKRYLAMLTSVYCFYALHPDKEYCDVATAH